MQENKLIFLFVDLFCGAGGTTTGVENARFRDLKCAKVIACVNHDPIAIKSHKANHDGVHHFTEDIRLLDMDVLRAVVYAEVARYKAMGYTVKLILWASLECTNFSNAKGGGTRDADSRTLAEHLPRYIEALDVDYVQIENVREFLAWGPLVPKLEKGGKACVLKYNQGKNQFYPVMVPESRTKGRDFMRWRYGIEDMGYRYDHRFLNSADFGANTKRVRYFGIFAKHGLPIVFPEATHSKGGKTPGTEPWRPASEHIDFEDKGKSIFGRKRKNGSPADLSPKSYARVFAGLCKYVAGGDAAFIAKYFSGRPEGKVIPVSAPAGTIKCVDSQALIQVQRHGAFLSTYNSGWDSCRNTGMNEPVNTITTNNRFGLVQPISFLTQTYAANSKGDNITSVEDPLRTITTRDGHAVVQASFITSSNGGAPAAKVSSVDEPARVITTADNKSVVQASFITQRNGGEPEHRATSVEQPVRTITTSGGNMELVTSCFLVNYYSSGGQMSNIGSPCSTITTRDRLGLVWVDKNYSGTHNHQPVTEPMATILTTGNKLSLVFPAWLDKQYGSGDMNHQSTAEPAGTLTANPKLCLMQPEPFILNQSYRNTGSPVSEPSPTIMASRRYHYLVNPQYKNDPVPVDQPSPVLIASMGKRPLSLVEVEQSPVPEPETWTELPTDCHEMRLIRRFMREYGIADIRMRMLKVPELLGLQGFPPGYLLCGTQEDMKKFIGNSVVPKVPQAWIEALYLRVCEDELELIAA